MKVVENGGKILVLGNAVNIKDKLEPSTYNLDFSKFDGLFLERREEFSLKEKIYGKISSKSKKIFNTFESSNRNIGILLSGEKGLGKSMFMKKIAIEAIEKGFPVICVNNNFPGISSFIQSIDQSVVWLFDEFEKIFPMNEDEEASIEELEKDRQNQFLSVLDGTTSNRHIIIATCNNTKKVSPYFLNRPGRFYYHFKFKRPDDQVLSEYLEDHLIDSNQKFEIIEKISIISKFGNFNFDALRAIVSELNNGYSFEETIEDLNIKIGERYNRFKITAVCDDGQQYVSFNNLDFPDFGIEDVYFRSENDSSYGVAFILEINSKSMKYDKNVGKFFIDASLFKDVKYQSNFGKQKGGRPVKLKSLFIEQDNTKYDYDCFFNS